MAYSEKQIADAVSTVHMNSRRQAKRNLTTNFANGDINYIGDCAFAYSGEIGITSAVPDTILLEFTNGPNYIDANFSLYNTSGSGDDIRYIASLNDVIVVSMYANSGNDFLLDTPVDLIIPPFAKLTLTGKNISSGTARSHTATMKGKVYSGAEIIQGAI
jgi:hypothetical protein